MNSEAFVTGMAQGYAAQSGERTAVVKINGIFAWCPYAELSSYTDQFSVDIVQGVIFPVKWIETHAMNPDDFREKLSDAAPHVVIV